jgi:hypothetical protein
MIAGQESRQAVVAVGDRVLLIRPDGHEATGREVEARTTGLALTLHQHGLTGQRIGLWSWNSAAAIEAHLATEWIGATRVPCTGVRGLGDPRRQPVMAGGGVPGGGDGLAGELERDGALGGAGGAVTGLPGAEDLPGVLDRDFHAAPSGRRCARSCGQDRRCSLPWPSRLAHLPVSPGHTACREHPAHAGRRPAGR